MTHGLPMCHDTAMPEAAELSGTLLRAICEGARGMGIDVDGMLARVGLYEAELDDPDLVVPVAVESRLWQAFLAGAGHVVGLGVRAAEALDRGAFRELEYVVRTSENLGSGLSKLVAFDRLLHGVDTFCFEVDSETAQVEYLHPHGDDTHEAYAASEFALAVLVALGRDATGVDWKPERVWFRGPAPLAEKTEPLDKFFRVPVSFGKSTTALFLDRSLLGTPMADADPELTQVLEHCLQKRISEHSPTRPLSEAVESAIVQLLPYDTLSIDTVARRFDLKARTLQERLKKDGTSYQEILDRTRETLAKSYLENGRSVAAIAFLLSYADVRAFRRAFRRWANCSPQEYKKRLKEEKGTSGSGCSANNPLPRR